MKRITKIVLLVVALAIVGCKKDIAEPPEDLTPSFALVADRTNGTAPLTVNFTGMLSGKIDTVSMRVPDAILFPGSGRTIIAYALPDTFQPAKSGYNQSFTYGAGTFKAMMRLQSKHRTYLSDTITIVVN